MFTIWGGLVLGSRDWHNTQLKPPPSSCWRKSHRPAETSSASRASGRRVPIVHLHGLVERRAADSENDPIPVPYSPLGILRTRNSRNHRNHAVSRWSGGRKSITSDTVSGCPLFDPTHCFLDSWRSYLTRADDAVEGDHIGDDAGYVHVFQQLQRRLPTSSFLASIDCTTFNENSIAEKGVTWGNIAEFLSVHSFTATIYRVKPRDSKLTCCCAVVRCEISWEIQWIFGCRQIPAIQQGPICHGIKGKSLARNHVFFFYQ